MFDLLFGFVAAH